MSSEITVRCNLCKNIIDGESRKSLLDSLMKFTGRALGFLKEVDEKNELRIAFYFRGEHNSDEFENMDICVECFVKATKENDTDFEDCPEE